MKFDKTAYKINSFKEADLQKSYWQTKSFEERLAAANQMIKIADGLVGKLKIEKNITAIIKRKKY